MDINLTNCTVEDVIKLQEILGFDKVEIKDSGVKRCGEKIGSLGLPRKPMSEIIEGLQEGFRDLDLTTPERPIGEDPAQEIQEILASEEYKKSFYDRHERFEGSKNFQELMRYRRCDCRDTEILIRDIILRVLKIEGEKMPHRKTLLKILELID